MKIAAANQYSQQSKSASISKTVQSKAPAKLILSGEHAVLYQCPALSLAIKLYSHCESHYQPLKHANEAGTVTIQLIDFQQSINLTFSELIAKAQQIEKTYQAFLNGTLAITDVLKEPSDLFIVALQLFHNQHALNAGHWQFNLTSQIPTGRGLGSSASVIVSFLSNLYEQHRISKDNNELLQLAQAIENRQHGKSSGLDPATIIYGGLVLFRNGQIEEKLNSANIQAWLVDTGAPLSSTGEAVLQVQHSHATQTDLWSDFSHCSLAMFGFIKELINQPQKFAYQTEMPLFIEQNQHLLEKIKIVPKKVKTFINILQTSSSKQKFSAKVCGSGSVNGDKAGVLLVMPKYQNETLNWQQAEQILQLECAKMDYNLIPIQADNHGIS